jgi:PAS domain S-box-containing protein
MHAPIRPPATRRRSTAWPPSSLASHGGKLIAVALCAAFMLISINLELFEHSVGFVQSHEEWELDEILGGLFLAGLTAIGLLFRRTRELRREIELRELAERKATEQNELLLLAQRAAGAGAWSIDPATWHTKLSPAAKEMLGIPAGHHGELSYRGWAKFLHSSDILKLADGIRHAMDQGSAISEEYRVKRTDGSLRWLQSIGQVVENGPGGKRLIGLTLDVTDRMTAIDALRESEERLRLALEAASDGAWDWDIAGGAVSLAARISETMGYGSEVFEGRGTDFTHVIHSDDRERLRKAVTDHLKGLTERCNCEIRFRTHNGGWRWIHVRGRVVARDEKSGRAIRMLGVTTDVTERKRAEEKALEEANLLALAKDGAGAGAWSLDLATRLTTVSPRGIDMLGLPEAHDGKIGLRDWRGIIHPEDIEGVTAVIKAAIENSSSYAAEYRVQVANGSFRWIHSLGRVLLDGSGQPNRLIGLMLDVTDRKAAADALRDSEERLRLALEAAGDGAWDWNVAEGMISLSDRLVQNLGYGNNRFEGHVSSFTRLVHRDDMERVRKAFTDHLAGRSDSYHCEYRVRTSDKKWRWNLDRGRVVARDPETGRATRMVGTSSDITAFKAAEQRALDQANLLAVAQSGAGAGAWSHDLETSVTTASPQAVELLGLPTGHSGQIEFSLWNEMVHPDDVKATGAALKRAIEERCDYSAEYRVKLPDGNYRWLQSLGRFVEDAATGETRLIGLKLDVTDRKSAADALRQSEERLRLALEAAGDGAWDWNLATGEVSRSRRLIDRLGYCAEEFGGDVQFLTSLIHPDDLAEVRQAQKDYLAGRTDSYQAEYRLRAADGKWHWILDRGRAVEWESDTGNVTRIVGTGSDVTARKEGEVELQRVQGELIHLSRLSAMGAMASTLAHELNQPLTAIANYARGIRHCTNLEGQDLLAEAVQGVEEGSQRAGDIVRRLREYVTRGELERRVVSLSQIVKEACGLALVDAGSMGVEHRIELDPKADKVLADKVQVQQVLLNLVRNAVEAMVEHGGERRLLVSSHRSGRKKQIEISVADSGPGIAEEIRDELFTPFVSTKTEGMGVGLSICRTIIEAHDGRIWAEPAPGGGNVMRFTLPLA